MSPDTDPVDPDQMEKESKESIRKVRKLVQDHETIVPKDDAETPLFRPGD
jgi:hypothetical protein